MVRAATVATQRSGKHASTTIEGLCFLLGPCRGVILKRNWRCSVDADSNTSTAGLRVVGGNEREPSAWGFNWATLFMGDINMGTWSSRLGEFRT
jgi:hypothetical protein